MKILAIIPARGGSKGLPRKNILNLGGKPLIAWSIEASLKSKYISQTVVSSDNNNILSVAKQYGADTIRRADEIATDTASSESVVIHVLGELGADNFDYVILLQPTSPLRGVQDIDKAIKKLLENNATALISVCETDNKCLKAFKEDNQGYIKAIANNRYPFMRRQDLPNIYLSNGAIYIIKTDAFMKHKCFLADKTIAYTMDSVTSLDIDTEKDLKSCEKICKTTHQF